MHTNISQIENDLSNLAKKLKFAILEHAKTSIKYSPILTTDALHQGCRTKFGGMPYAEKGDTWPACQTCKNEMDFLTQTHNIQLDELLVFFYCMDCNPCDHEDAGEWQARVYNSPSELKMVPLPKEEPAKTDTVSCFYQESTMLTIDPELGARSFETYITPIAQVHFEKKYQEKMHPDRASYRLRALGNEFWWDIKTSLKLLEDENHVCTMYGFPQYSNGYPEPECPHCNEEMFFYFKIASPDLDLNVNFGGELFLYRCKNHPNEVQMVWDGT